MSTLAIRSFLGLAACVVLASAAHAGRNDFDFKLGAFSNNPAIAQSAFSSEASDLKRNKQERADEIKQAKDDNEFFARTAESGVVSIITQRIQSESSGSAQSGSELIRWTTSGGVRTVEFVDAVTGVVKRTITFSV